MCYFELFVPYVTSLDVPSLWLGLQYTLFADRQLSCMYNFDGCGVEGCVTRVSIFGRQVHTCKILSNKRGRDLAGIHAGNNTECPLARLGLWPASKLIILLLNSAGSGLGPNEL